MPEKIAAPSKRVDPKKKPIRRPDDKKAPSGPDVKEHPTRDTRDTPAPNSDGSENDTKNSAVPIA